MSNSLPHWTASLFIQWVEKNPQKDYDFLSLSFPTCKKESLNWITDLPPGFHRALGFYGGNSGAAAGVNEAMGAGSEARALHGHLGCEALWRAS